MIRIYIFTLTTLIAFLFSTLGYSQGLFYSQGAEPIVRVLLAEHDAPYVHVMQGAHQGTINHSLSFRATGSLAWPIEVEGDHLVIDGRRIGRSLRLMPEAEAPVVTWQDKRYHGGLEFIAAQGKLLVINITGLEAYVRGVVPAEMNPTWHLEALKAQAIAARTFVLKKLDPEADYDICATVRCQVYHGLDAEHPNSNRAVHDTAGMALFYGQHFAQVYYHADSGGSLASSLEVWGENHPYMLAKRDHSVVPRSDGWSARLSPQTIQRSLAPHGYTVSQVYRVEVTTRDSSGRVRGVRVYGRGGSVRIVGNWVQPLLRSWGLKSTLFDMTGALQVWGRGHGHGVGMSQVSVVRLAHRGHTYTQILNFYYPGTVMQPIGGSLRAKYP